MRLLRLDEVGGPDHVVQCETRVARGNTEVEIGVTVERHNLHGVVHRRGRRLAFVEHHLLHVHHHLAMIGLAGRLDRDEDAFALDVEEAGAAGATGVGVAFGAVVGRGDGHGSCLIVNARGQGETLAERAVGRHLLDLHAVGVEAHLHLVGEDLQVIEALDVHVQRELLVGVDLVVAFRVLRLDGEGLDHVQREGQLRGLRERGVGDEAKARLVGLLFDTRHVSVDGQVEGIRLARRDGAGRLVNGQPLAALEDLHIVDAPGVDVEGVTLEGPGHVELVGAHVLVVDRDHFIDRANSLGRELGDRGPGLATITSRLHANVEFARSKGVDNVGELDEHLSGILRVELRRDQALGTIRTGEPVEAGRTRIHPDATGRLFRRGPVFAVVRSGPEPVTRRELRPVEVFLEEERLSRRAGRQHREVVLQRVAAGVGDLYGLFLRLADVGLLLEARRVERERGSRDAFADERDLAGRDFLTLDGHRRREFTDALRREGHVEDPCITRLKRELRAAREGEVLGVDRHVGHVQIGRAVVAERDHLRARRVVHKEVLVLEGVLRDEGDRSGLDREVHR